MLLPGGWRDENSMDYEEKTASKWRKKGRMQVNSQENKDTRKVPLKAIFILIFMQISIEITSISMRTELGRKDAIFQCSKLFKFKFIQHLLTTGLDERRYFTGLHRGNTRVKIRGFKF